MISSRTTMTLNICAARRARPATSRARCRTAAIHLRARARGRIRRRPRSKATAIRCSPRPRKQLGYKPYPQPSGNLSQSYTNPLGVTLGQCTFCGFCEWFGCANYSKASPQTTILPVLLRCPNFEARTECEVMRINLDNTGKRATGVTYVEFVGRRMGAARRSGAAVCASSSSTSSFCCCPASARHTIRRPAKARSGAISPIRPCRPRSASSTRTNTISIRSSLRARSACASTSSTATISIMARWALSAADISGRSGPTAVRSRA